MEGLKPTLNTDDSPPSTTTTCRCCMVASICKNITLENFWNGQRVIYSDLLRDTFGLALSGLEGLPNTICENCIFQLIDATEFKKKVQKSEATLKKQFASTSTDTLNGESDHKLEKVMKKEPKDTANIIFDDIETTDDHEYDTLLSEIKPKVALQRKTVVIQKNPKLNPNSNLIAKKILVPASRLKDVTGMPASSGIKSMKIGNRTVYVKVHNIKPRSSLSSKKVLIKPKKTLSDSLKIKQNRDCLLLHSTMYPFRLPPPYLLLGCVYCKQLIEPTDYGAHIEEKHPYTNNPKEACMHSPDIRAQIKVDCSDLKCRMCKKSFENLEIIAEHLNKEHNKNIDFTVDFGVAPFKFKKGEVLSCAYCRKQVANVFTLSKHMATHYSRCICDQCGKSFASPITMNRHRMDVHVDKPKCRHCKATFETQKELTIHHQNIVKCRVYACPECDERFVRQMQLWNHLSSVHGIDRRARKCLVCQKQFPSYQALSQHNVKEHFTDSYRCEICDKKFSTAKHLTEHSSIHSGATPYQCEMCDKSYSVKKHLAQHIRIKHRQYYSCNNCKKHFGCKSSLTNHRSNCHL